VLQETGTNNKNSHFPVFHCVMGSEADFICCSRYFNVCVGIQSYPVLISVYAA